MYKLAIRMSVLPRFFEEKALLNIKQIFEN